jgi:hypothetical protein
LAEAKKRAAAQIKLKKSLTLTTAVMKETEDTMMIEVAEMETTTRVVCPPSEPPFLEDVQQAVKKRRRERLEEQKRSLEAEKAASRARTRGNVLRHFVLPAALVTAGLLAGGALMWRRRMR